VEDRKGRRRCVVKGEKGSEMLTPGRLRGHHSFLTINNKKMLGGSSKRRIRKYHYESSRCHLNREGIGEKYNYPLPGSGERMNMGIKGVQRN